MMEPKATRYEPIVVSSESTVVAEFVPDAASATSYQSEADLERQLVKLLQGQAYDYLPITSEYELVRWIKDQSGLTWEQIARAFDVSRRAVHLWANGGRVSAGNAEAIQSFAALVRGASSATLDETRNALLSVGSDGLSPLDRFRQSQYESSVAITGSPLTPAELLGDGSEAAQ